MSEKSLEEEVKLLQKPFGGFVIILKNQKVSVEALEKKADEKENKEIKEILEAQVVST